MTKTFRIFFLFLLLSSGVLAQDTVMLEHTYYTSHFVNSKHIPWRVEYTLHKSDVSCPDPIKRKDNFRSDPLNREFTLLGTDYEKSGYDQGHCMPSANNLCNGEIAEKECCYYSNIMPQTPRLNRGLWRLLEDEERKMAIESDSIFVCIGNWGTAKTIGDDKVVVPRYCWKVIYDYKKNEWWAYAFPNTETVTGKIQDFAVSVAEIEEKTGIEFVVE